MKKQVSIRVGRHSFKISCEEKDVRGVLHATATLNHKIEEARQKAGATDSERALLMAALLAIVEAQQQGGEGEWSPEKAEAVREAGKKIADALAQTESVVAPTAEE